MKKTTMLLLGMLLLMAAIISSCGNVQEIPVNIVIVNGEGDELYNYDYTYIGETPTVYDATAKMLEENDVPFEIQNDSIISIDGLTEEGDYYWTYSLNGVSENLPRASAQAIAANDKIVWTYTLYVPDAE